MIPSASRLFRRRLSIVAGVLAGLLGSASLHAEVIWTEGEKPVRATLKRHPWYSKVKTEQLSGNDFISNFGEKPGEAEYSVTASKAGDYEFWIHANPVGAAMSYSLNDTAPVEIDFNKDQREITNIAGDGKIDIRFIAWTRVGGVTLKQGANTIVFRMHSKNNNHGMLDCFVLANEPFEPHGVLKPGEAARPAQTADGWFAFNPPADHYTDNAGFDLRSLNEKLAGDGGFIAAKDGQFIQSLTGKPIRFWGVDAPPDKMNDRALLRNCGRMLAKHGVNCVRFFSPFYDKHGVIDPAAVQHNIDIIESMKEDGVYSIMGIYWFPFITPGPNDPILPGYDGKKTPIGVLFFNQKFQELYRSWWTTLLTTPGKVSGKRLIDEPALAGLEVQNEDGLFFWSFSDQTIPDPEMRIVEKMYGDWLIKKYGSLEAAVGHWKGVRHPRDNPAEGRMGFRNMWSVFHERAQRDKDGITFLTEVQSDFYKQMIAFLRKTGFKGVICTSGWTTADPQVLGPVDKYTNTLGDYIDRHGYFGPDRKGQNAGWAVMGSQTYADRSALRFDAELPGKPKVFANPVMDPHYNDKPSFISETSIERPNRYRSEAPLYYACYGALQDSGGFAHFALDTAHWTVKPGYFMQPWTLMSPDSMGQFPAAALIFREGLISPGDVLVDLNLKIADIENLKGTPMPQDAALDAFRLKDIPSGTVITPNSVIDPLIHYAGRSSVHFTGAGGPSKLVDLAPYIDHSAQTVLSTNHQLKLDYGKGLLIINAPAAQGISGNLKSAGTTETSDLTLSSDLDLGHIIAVSLDGKPLATSGKILLQVMSEDQPTGFRAEPIGNGLQRIDDIGRDPWLVKNLSGAVKFKRADAASLKVVALDPNGYPVKTLGSAAEIKLNPDSVYYLVTR